MMELRSNRSTVHKELTTNTLKFALLFFTETTTKITREQVAVASQSIALIGDSHDGQIFDGHGHVQDNHSQS